QPTILLAGGLDRGNSFDELLASMKNVKAMVLFGETKEKLKHTANKANIPVAIADTVTDATKTAHEMSSPGDVILLSPACASWDEYETVEESGSMFVQGVHAVQEEKNSSMWCMYIFALWKGVFLCSKIRL